MEYNSIKSINKIGERVKSIRMSKELSINDLAWASGLSISYIERLEQGKRRSPSVYSIVRLSKALGITVDSLINDINNDKEVAVTPPIEVQWSSRTDEILKSLTCEEQVSLIQIIKFILTLDWDKEEERFQNIFDLSLLVSQFKNGNKKSEAPADAITYYICINKNS